uniref:NTR domain-containing protein n=1 Tax=Strongyloides papillosus TaxID=174720 RepID=A0A0N5C3N1_STREA
MRVSNVSTVFIIILIFNIVRIFAWKYRIYIKGIPLCWPGKDHEWVLMRLRVGNNWTYFSSYHSHCDKEFFLVTSLSAGIYPIRVDGRVNIVYDDLPWGDTVKDILEDCVYFRTWGNKYCCDYGEFGPPHFTCKLRDKYFCDKAIASPRTKRHLLSPEKSKKPRKSKKSRKSKNF